ALLCTKIKWNWSPKPHRLPSVTTLLSCPILTLANLNMAVVDWDAVPDEPAPVIVTEKVFAVEEVQDNDDVPVPLAVRDTGVTVNALQVKPEGRGVSERATEPTKLNVLVRVMVEVADAPAAPLGDVAPIVKSPTWTVETAE